MPAGGGYHSDPEKTVRSSSGLGLRPLTAATRVRIPYGLLKPSLANPRWGGLLLWGHSRLPERVTTRGPWGRVQGQSGNLGGNLGGLGFHPADHLFMDTLPPEDCCGLDDVEGRAPVRPEATQRYPEQPIPDVQPGPRGLLLQGGQLLSEGEVLQCKGPVGLEDGDEAPQKGEESGEHVPLASPGTDSGSRDGLARSRSGIGGRHYGEGQLDTSHAPAATYQRLLDVADLGEVFSPRRIEELRPD